MSAIQSSNAQGSLSTFPSKIAIIAGGGSLPEQLARACEAKGMEVFIIAFKGQTDPELYEPRMHLLTSLSKAGKIVNALKEKGFSDLVFIGSIRRPNFMAMIPDAYTAKFLIKVGFASKLGDDGLLKSMRSQLESDGFRFHGAQDFLDGLFISPGALGKHAPPEADLKDIEYGFQASQDLGRQDIGQAVIVDQGKTIGREDREGTNALIARCSGGILVKTCKPQQDKQLDLPTIGPETVKAAIASDLRGIAVQAGEVFVVDKDQVIRLADEAGLFIYGISA